MFLSLSLFFFSRSTFLSEYHTVAHSMPSIIQTVCPEKLSFASTVPEYFSRPRVFLTHMERHNGGHNEDILTLFFFFPQMNAMYVKTMCDHNTAISQLCSLHSPHGHYVFASNKLTNFKQHETSGNTEGKCSNL